MCVNRLFIALISLKYPPLKYDPVTLVSHYTFTFKLKRKSSYRFQKRRRCSVRFYLLMIFFSIWKLVLVAWNHLNSFEIWLLLVLLVEVIWSRFFVVYEQKFKYKIKHLNLIFIYHRMKLGLRFSISDFA